MMAHVKSVMSTWMRNVGFVTAAVLLGVICLAMSSAAGDVIIDVPDGWQVEPQHTPFCASPEGVAFTAHQRSPTGVYVSARLIQIRGTASTYTDVEGKIDKLEYSPDGTLILVHGARALNPGVSFATGPWVALVSGTGAVSWSKNDSREFSFSTDGAKIVAVLQNPASGQDPNRWLEVFDISGNSQGKVDTADSARNYRSDPDRLAVKDPKRTVAEPPPGFVLREGIYQGRQFMFSKNQVLIRQAME